MKLLYVSCHQVLEYDEVKLFHEMGIDVFSTGSYACPWYRDGMIRPGIDGLHHYEDMERIASTFVSGGYFMPQELIDWADTIVFMHMPEALQKNWPRLKHKRVIFRSIGQCVGHQENLLRDMKAEGLEIVRYSPKEKNIPNYAGENALIRFYKDPNEYGGYTGDNPVVVNFTQSLKQRQQFTHCDEVLSVLNHVPSRIYGVSNEDLGDKNGGQLDFDNLKRVMRDSRAYLYAGTWPASYTLSFIEAMMTGIPIIAMGKRIAESTQVGSFDFYEIPDIISDGVNGFVSDDIEELRESARILIQNKEIAKSIGNAGRERAIQLFGRETVAKQWKEFLCL